MYGPRQNYTRKHPPLLSQLIKSILTDQKVTIYNLNKNIKRDYIYIDDLIALISKIINDKKHTLPRLINACSGESLSVPEIIKKIELIAKKQFIIESPKHSSNFWGKYKQLFQGKYKIKDIIIENEIYKKAEGDPSVFKSIIKKEPINFENGIKKCMEYAKKLSKNITLILPVSGKSSRFKDSDPKWILTSPSGKLMIQEAIVELDLKYVNKILIICLKQHINKYIELSSVKKAISEIVGKKISVEVCILSKPTTSQAHTIYNGIKK